MVASNTPASAPEVSDDALQSTLNDLLKAAESTATLSKGDSNAVSHSGTYGSDGPQGGGRAGYGDAGGLDKMMIAKMIDTGAMVPTAEFMHGFQEEEDGEDEDSEMGGYFRGFMHGFSKDEPNVGDGRSEAFMHGYMRGHKKGGDMVGYGGGNFVPVQRPEPTGKSDDTALDGDPLSKALRDDPTIQEAVDASDFMEAITNHVAQALDTIQKSLDSHGARQGNLNVANARATLQLGNLLKSQGEIAEALNERLKLVERTPNPPKGATSLKGAEAMAKSADAGGASDGGGGLRKSEVVSTLSWMNLEKGIHEIGGRKTSDLVVSAEAGNIVDQPTLDEVNRYLKTHPNEAEQARNYA